MNVQPNSFLLGFSEIIIYIVLFLSATPLLAGSQSKYGLNLYVLFIMTGCFIKFIPENVIKHGKKILEKIPSFKESTFLDKWKRPEEARYCSLLGPFGKEKADTPGMPSGHSIVISYIVTFLLFNIIELKRERRMNFSYLLVLFLVLFAILVPLSRIELKCHTYPQIIVGMIIGFIIGFTFYMVDKMWLRKYESFSKDREEFYKLLSS